MHDECSKKYYCYTGDVKKLIPNGWRFQKLYASNYKAYHKDSIFMFVISKMAVEISDLKARYQAMLIDFILENKDKDESFWHSVRSGFPFKGVLFDNWVIQNGTLLHHTEATRNKMKWYDEFKKDNTIKYLEDGYCIGFSMVTDILNLHYLGGLTLKEST